MNTYMRVMSLRYGRPSPAVDLSGDAPPERFTREMGFTLQDYLRTLPAALGELEYRVVGRETIVHHPSGEIRIRLHPTGVRRIAALAIPLTPVEFSFSGLDAVERKRFLDRFDRYFQRGGG